MTDKTDDTKCPRCGGAGWIDCGVNAAYILAGFDDSCPKCKGTGKLEPTPEGEAA